MCRQQWCCSKYSHKNYIRHKSAFSLHISSEFLRGFWDQFFKNYHVIQSLNAIQFPFSLSLSHAQKMKKTHRLYQLFAATFDAMIQ